jgi:hypothetical protein
VTPGSGSNPTPWIFAAIQPFALDDDEHRRFRRETPAPTAEEMATAAANHAKVGTHVKCERVKVQSSHMT